ncbi:NAD(P)-dependent oxidoreductase [Piscinibacter koreensis]|uniref:Phosphoglycerate dehydrogenase n=1 Tax=Piscinibacter koreensis TaxID=2742824 RepID=A0A7Y6NLS6_9BURK|nr:NAD(P)-dependent oxidoreductase [Schlegelella koreensis]NUZ05437.1 phosphoglycerate dehydrogenase [Schlegelella koreensis]
MTLLIADSLEADVLDWLRERHAVREAPELANDQRALRRALYNVRAMIVPASVTLDAQTLHHAPVLRAVGRISAGAESIDLEACARARIEVVRSPAASATAEAEFAVGAMLSMLRRVPVSGSDGLPVGRELGAATIGLIGMPPAARSVAQMLAGFGSRVIGYDPALHASDGLWSRWRVAPVGLRELIESADAVCVLLSYFSRFRGLLGERFLPTCKPNQVLVCLSYSGLFDETCLADALRSGRIAAAWLDSLEPGALEPGRPLHGIPTLQVTPRVASITRESRQRTAWAVARRIDDILNLDASVAREFRATAPSGTADLGAGPWLP